MYSDKLLDHFRNPRNSGELQPPALRVEVSNPACGDILRLSADCESGRAAEVRYKVRGCTASIAAGSALTELMAGRTRTELSALRAADIEAALGGLPPESKHAAALCIDGLRALLEAWAAAGPARPVK
ncbi:MAG: iron-sulfur cluster assembly scaffold protein [Acidobacteria bacterium]|nr:iron-sulfur cluster assembly scaffold protein [Acidobacteriota bacterium]MBI3279946.1 iron-sulfur cluster assembly scaffold protein [Acidobacteriota bacterium]